MYPVTKEPVRKTFSLKSQSSVELDAGRLVELLTSDDKHCENHTDVKITRGSLSKISADLGLSEEELDIIFQTLDTNGDGVITAAELRQRSHSDDFVLEKYPDEVEVLPELSEELTLLDGDCQEQVCELYQQLHHSGAPELLELFENVILGILKDMRQHQVENERLEKSYKREKETHERHMRQMEEEMEVQMQRIEERERKRVQEQTENEKAEMRDKVQEEINMLTQNLKRLQQEGPEARNKEIEEQLIQLKGKVEEMTFTNRQLKSELTDNQTNLALLKSDYASMKQQFNEKKHELEMEKEAIKDFQREQENLTRQLHLLHDANKRLHDTNDDLRESIETSRRSSPMRQQSIASNASTIRSIPADYRRGSLMSEYFQSTPMIRSRMGSTQSLVEENEPPQQHHVTMSSTHVQHHTPRMFSVKLPHQDTCESDGGILEDIDSGHSTLRDGGDNDLENDAFLNDAETMQRVLAGKKTSRKTRLSHTPIAEDLDSHDEIETESEAPGDMLDVRRHQTDSRRLGSASSRSSSSKSSRSRDGTQGRVARRQSTLTQEITPKVNKDPERMFKVVLAGDAAVGKSSLIMRLCKGKFVGNLSSTLGVDFQTKMIELDGRSIALQLWDTAGQERFRSIAKSYFRRADGVLLLYDVTYERSFLSIREWMDSIEDGAIKKLPIMLCGNKTDMREEAEQHGRKTVTYDDGQRLARECGALFIETSAKSGSNVDDAVSELTRLMRANEDLEVKTSGLQLHDKSVESKQGCCGR